MKSHADSAIVPWRCKNNLQVHVHLHAAYDIWRGARLCEVGLGRQVDAAEGHSELAAYALGGTAGTPTLQPVRLLKNFAKGRRAWDRQMV